MPSYEIFTLLHEDGTHQKYQVVSGFSWDEIKYFSPGISAKTITELVRLFSVNIVPKLKEHKGGYVFFSLPEDVELSFDRNRDIGFLFDDDLLLRSILEQKFQNGEVKVENGILKSTDCALQTVLDKLYQSNLIGYCDDCGPGLNFVAVNKAMGFVSCKKASVCVNSHFFLMDPSDMDSPYCKIGTPHGLVLQHGHVYNPPINHRKLLLVDKSSNTKLAHVELDNLTFVIDGIEYIPGQNCTLHFRPDERVTPQHCGSDLIITEEAVTAVKDGGEAIIPVAGFVLSTFDKVTLTESKVIYKGLEDYIFGSQVGPEMVEEFGMKDSLNFPFYVKGRDKVIYAPTVYPLPYESARAARICLGSDKDNKPVLIWAEGEGKLGINKELDSTGASLLEMAQFCKERGFKDIINLDGGGSAEILFSQQRALKVADRLPITNKECERPVPNGLYIM